jgi:hypothetical protein
LTVSGPVADSGAGTIALTTKTGGIALAGTVSTTGTVDLISAGAITQTGGTLSAGTLTGSAATSASLTASNAVATLGGFTATSGFTLMDVPALSVSGAVNGGTSVSITDSGALTVGGSVTGTTVALTAAGISIPGSVSGPTSVTLTSSGAITETGSLSAGTLSGSAATSASLTGTNSIATLGGFTATTGFTLMDVPALSVSGTVNGGTSVAITDSGALTVSGSVTGTTVALTAAGISLPGSVSGPTSVALTSGGAITETGSISTALLSGSAGTSASLTGTNSVATLGGFTATTGFTLMNVPALTVSGAVNGGTSVSITDSGTLSIPGSITGTAVALASAGNITESGSINTGLLTGSAGGSADFTGTNAIAGLGNFTASGFMLNDGTGLTVSGKLAGGAAATIVDTGTLTVASGGTVTASAISLTGDAIAIPGLVTDGGSGTVALVANTGTINETGTLIAGTLSGSASGAASFTGATPTTNQVGTVSNFTASGFTLDDGVNLTLSGTVNGGPSVTLVDNGTINQTGTLIAGILAGSATSAANFLGASATANQIGALGNFTSSGLVLNDGANLLIQGLVNAGANAVINDAGAISETGTLIAATLAGSAGGAANFTGANQVDVLGNFTAAGFALNDGKALAVSGILNGGSSVTLNGAGAITETGTIIAGTLSGSASGAANFSGANGNANQIAALGNFTAGGFTLADGRSLAINGTVDGGPSANVSINGGSLTINGRLTANTVTTSASGDITIPGTLQDANSVNLFSGGSVSETGVLIADVLNGNVAGDAIMIGNNQVIQLGSFTAGGRFVLNDGVNLTIGGTLTAPRITVNDFGNTLAFANNARLVTSGDIRPSGTSVPTGLTPAGGAPGALFQAGTFNQVGASFVTGIGGGPSTLQISTTGNMQFANLQAPNTWLILNVTSGQINGNIVVGALDVSFVQANAGSQLGGTIGQFSGQAAAGAGNIQPTANSNFRFNSCAIHSVNCVLLPTQGLPTANPLNDITIGSLFNPDDQDDLLLPIVSDQDY